MNYQHRESLKQQVAPRWLVNVFTVACSWAQHPWSSAKDRQSFKLVGNCHQQALVETQDISLALFFSWGGMLSILCCCFHRLSDVHILRDPTTGIRQTLCSSLQMKWWEIIKRISCWSKYMSAGAAKILLDAGRKKCICSYSLLYCLWFHNWGVQSSWGS